MDGYLISPELDRGQHVVFGELLLLVLKPALLHDHRIELELLVGTLNYLLLDTTVVMECGVVVVMECAVVE